MKHITIAVLTAFMAVFLWANTVHAQSPSRPLVFSKHAARIAQQFGEVAPENVLIVVVTKAPVNTAYVVVIMKNGHRFKWARGPYDIAIKLIQSVLEKIKAQERVSYDL